MATWCPLLGTIKNFDEEKIHGREQHEGNARICLVMSAIEGVDASAIAAQCRDRSAVGVKHRHGLAVALFGAGGDCLAHRFEGKYGRNAMSL